MPSSKTRWLRFVPTHTYDSLVADLRVYDFMFSVCQICSNATHFNILSILRSHFSLQSRDRILRNSDGRTWSWPLANIVDRNPRLWVSIRAPAITWGRQHLFIPAELVWTCRPLDSVPAETRHSPIPWRHTGDRQHNKVKRPAETIRRFDYCLRHTASPTSGMNDIQNLFCSNTLICIAFVLCGRFWVVLGPPHFTCQ